MNWHDIFWRAVWTFIEAFTAVLLAAGLGWFEVETIKMAATAGGAALLSLIKNIAAQQLGYTGSQQE